jgi:hypothetical protein
VQNFEAFRSRYGDLPEMVGQFRKHLSHVGESITLTGPVGEPIQTVAYSASWHLITDSLGFSLVPAQENLAKSWISRADWRPSSDINGSPGQSDPAPPTFPRVIIRTVYFDPGSATSYTLQLRNMTYGAVDLSGWFISDNLRIPAKFRVPDGTIIPSGRVLDLKSSWMDQNSYSRLLVPPTGGELFLISADSLGCLKGYFYGFKYGTAARFSSADGDADGIPDAWEMSMGINCFSGTGENGAFGDPDGDGVSNFDEFISGTNPLDPHSFLFIKSLQPGLVGNSIRFQVTRGRTYTLYYLDYLSGGPWQILQTLPSQTRDGEMEIIDSQVSSSTARFYRLGVP